MTEGRQRPIRLAEHRGRTRETFSSPLHGGCDCHFAAAINVVVFLQHCSRTLWVTHWARPLPSHGPELVFGRGVLYRCQVAQRQPRNNTAHSTGRQRVGELQLSKERAAIHSAVHNAEPDTAKPNRSNPALCDRADKAHLKQ